MKKSKDQTLKNRKLVLRQEAIVALTRPRLQGVAGGDEKITDVLTPMCTPAPFQPND